MRVLVWAVVLVAGCKGKGGAPAAGSAGSGSAGSASAAPVIDAAMAAPPSVDAAVAPALVFDDSEQAELAIPFEGKVPRLPAISADGTQVASFQYAGAPGMPVPAVDVVIRPLGGEGPAEQVALIEAEEVEGLADDWTTKPPKPALVTKLRARAAAIVKRLEGFQSLVPIAAPPAGDGNTRAPVKIGAWTFAAVETDDETVALTLTDGAGRVVRRATGEGYSVGSGDDACSFRPVFDSVYQDAARAKLYIAIDFRFRDDCGDPVERFIVWTLPTPEETALANVVVQQLDAKVDVENVYAPEALVVTGSELAPPKPERGGEHVDANVAVTPSADGRSAWASLTSKLAGKDVRASSVLAKTPAGWRIVASTWTAPQPNADVNRDAKAGKLKSPPAFTADPGDKALREAFAKLTTDGIATPPAELIAIGSGPGERTTSGPAFADAWNAAWKGKTAITSSIARLAPSGTTGWVAANVELAKGAYKIPFRIFAVFDKASSGEWTLVHVHFSVRAP